MKSAGILLPKYRPLLALVAGFFVIALSILALTSNAVAKNQTDLDREARDHAYYTALSGCAKYSMKDKITSSEPAQWYGNDFLGGSPYVYSAGKLNCSQVMTEAWGWWGSGKSATAFLTAMGYVNEGGTFTFKGGNADSRLANFRTELKKLKPGIDSISSAAKYLVYNNEKDCTSTGDRRILYGYVQSDGTAAVLGAVSKTCTEIASELPALKTAFETETQKDAQLAACVASGVKNPAACVKGNQNKSDIKYCFKPWSTEERDSCFSGQGNGAAPGCIAAGYGSGNQNALQACVAGSKNKNADYCAATYSSDESAGTLITACTDGQKLEAGINVDTAAVPAENLDCVANPNAEGCSEDVDETTCAIDGIGWIICPVMNFMGGVIDGSYAAVEGLLSTSPSMFNRSSAEGQATYDIWSSMRNIANALFVIAFMVIIYSQLTSTGVSNYGIKKLLPRLIIAAILVNTSFIISALAVDISNVVGASTKGLFENLAGSVSVEAGFWSGGGSPDWLTLIGGTLAGVGAAGGLLVAGGPTVLGVLAVLLPVLITAAVAIVTVVAVLALRQALIIILIIVSPLAFVALLLPNTENWFKKWRGLFFTMLLMYPAIALVFGASALAGKIVMLSASGNAAILVQIAGAGITIIPLFITPVIMKFGGGLLNRFAGIVNDKDKGIFDGMRKGAKGLREREEGKRKISSLNGGSTLSFGKFRRRARRDAITKGIESEGNRAQASYVSDYAQSNDTFRNKLAGGTAKLADPDAVQRALDNAINISTKLEADEISAAEARIDRAVIPREELRKLAMGETVEKDGQTYSGSSLTNQVAAQRQMAKSGDFEGMNMTWDHHQKQAAAELASGEQNADNQKLRKAFADTLAASNNRPAWMGQGALQNMREAPSIKKDKDGLEVRNEDGTRKLDMSTGTELVEAAIKNNTYSPEKIVATDKDELAIVANINHGSTNISVSEKQKIINNAYTAQTDPELSAKIGKNSFIIDDIRANRPAGGGESISIDHST